ARRPWWSGGPWWPPIRSGYRGPFGKPRVVSCLVHLYGYRPQGWRLSTGHGLPGDYVGPSAYCVGVTKSSSAKTAAKTSNVGVAMAPGPDREKALDLALAQIDKQFGKGSVMRLGERPVVPMAIIPTGSIALDLALGVGGLPRGRIVEIYGPESSGKCLTADTYLWTDRGLETIAELFARCGQPASCTNRITNVVEHGIRMVNERRHLETVAAVTHNNRKPVLRLTLRSGRTITATENHPLRVITERGFIAWRRVGG